MKLNGENQLERSVRKNARKMQANQPVYQTVCHFRIKLNEDYKILKKLPPADF
jgi:hypothetical protein